MVALKAFIAISCGIVMLGGAIAAPTRPVKEFPDMKNPRNPANREAVHQNLKAEAERINFVKGMNKALAADWCNSSDETRHLQKEFEQRPLWEQNKLIKSALETEAKDEQCKPM
jgi:hypothetical protein